MAKEMAHFNLEECSEFDTSRDVSALLIERVMYLTKQQTRHGICLFIWSRDGNSFEKSIINL